jgi:trimethylamine:corrinoid methyltransferase-like protein
MLDEVGVRFPSESVLRIPAEHGAQVDPATQIVRFPRDLVFMALKTVPRCFPLGAAADNRRADSGRG